MIINGFGGIGVRPMSQDSSWVTLHTFTISFSGALPTNYSGETGWLYPTGTGFSWPDVSGMSYIRCISSDLKITTATTTTIAMSSYPCILYWYFGFSKTTQSSLVRTSSTLNQGYRSIFAQLQKNTTYTFTAGVNQVTSPAWYLAEGSSGSRGSIAPTMTPALEVYSGNSRSWENYWFNTGWNWMSTTSSSYYFYTGDTIYPALTIGSATGGSNAPNYVAGTNFVITGTFYLQGYLQ